MKSLQNKCKCGGTVFEQRNEYRCDRCNATIRKRFFNTEISYSYAVDLFKGKMKYVHKLTSHGGKEFSAVIRLNKNGKIETVFEIVRKKPSEK